MVYVINQMNQPLMPCTNVIARLLLKQGKAKCIKRTPFTIKLTYKEWWKIRNPEKYEYNKMCEELNAYTIKNHNREADHFDFAREAELLNVIVTGKTSAELRVKYRVDTCDALRDNLRAEFNDQLLFLETQNQVLLLMNLPYEEREAMLTKMYNVKFNR
mgnify:CR=1 FL=1